MNIGFIALDSKIKNLAIEKIKYYYKIQDIIIKDVSPFEIYDNVYISKIFTKTPDYQYIIQCDRIYKGGTGYDLFTKLPKEIDIIKPHINQGFLTRGCIRNCDFCFVPKKEGKIYIEAEDGIIDLWDGKSKEIIIMDNNITALKDYYIYILKQAQELNIRLDFNQGLDIRLFDEDMAYEIKKTKTKEIRFAFDNISMFNIVEEKMKILKKYNIKAFWYVLCGFNSEIEDDFFRINYLVKNNQRPYVMRHEKCLNDRRYTAIATWCNSPLFGKATINFNDILKTDRFKSYQKYFKNMNIINNNMSLDKFF